MRSFCSGRGRQRLAYRAALLGAWVTFGCATPSTPPPQRPTEHQAMPDGGQDAGTSVSESPHDADFWVQLYDPNRAAFEKAVERGHLALVEGRFKAAFLAFDEAARLEPDDADARILAAGGALEAGEHASAVEHLLALRALQPNADVEHGVCFQLALAYANLGRYDDGIGEYDRCIGQLPKDAAFIHHNNVAELYMAKGDLESAIAHYRAAIDGFPTNVHGLFGLAVALDRAGQQQESREVLLRGLRVDPSVSFMFEKGTFFVPNGEKYYHLGLMYEGLGRWEDARRFFEKYEEIATGGRYHAPAQAHLKALTKQAPAQLDTFPAPAADVSAAVVDGERRWLAVGTTSGRISMVTLASGEVTDYRLDGAAVVDMAFTPKGELRVLQANGEVLRLDAAKALKKRGTVELSADAVIDLSADGASVLGTSGGDFVRYDLTKAGKRSRVTTAGLGFEATAALTPAGVLAVAVGRDGVYLDPGGTERGVFRAPERVLDMEALLDSRGFVLGMHTGAMLIDLDNQALHVILPTSGKVVQAVSLDPSGEALTLVVGTSIELWDVTRLPVP